MPRTKKPVKKTESSQEDGEAVKKIKKIVQEHFNKIDSRAQMVSRDIELNFKMLTGSIGVHLNKTVGQIKTELLLFEDLSRTQNTRHSSGTASHDDGYLTENSYNGNGDSGNGRKKPIMSVSSARSMSRPRRSRSADVTTGSVRRGGLSAAPPPSRAQPPRRRSRTVYRTPVCKSNINYPVITPKVAPNAPLAVLRQPRQGEMVYAMSGSPVMVPACFAMPSGEKANCNIMLKDGTTLSLQPKHLRQSQAFIPFSLMDNNVIHQLKTLKENLEKVVTLGEKGKLAEKLK